ncbi:segregation/condensation protein A [Phormidium sp. CCY1219]|jgi:segregation and condensation protein A|uniref:segregation/condensation protein A n=1 Tax=Phormidium sp. CCY1219 TaxID=2886104 RepID=UPI002D1EF6B8|nr:segregation/condensation protein A [Phormidium sp. CCY1219]MEB3828014.1 segregation/condensation protein A [Phormidium sp. CCY1219]
MSGSLAQNAIALLIDLAKQGEIDPWDVQVIDVIDRYLSRLVQVHEAGQVQREAALSESGQAFLYASMLVLLKADALARSESLMDEAETAEEETEELVDEADEMNDPTLPKQLELQLKRRAVAPTPKKRRVTLQELIEQLQLMSMAMENQPRRRSKRHKGTRSPASTVRALTELAEQENLSEIAARLEQFLLAYAQEVGSDRNWLELESLLERWKSGTRESKPAPSHLKHHDRVGVFSALLMLSAQSKVELVQEKFYGELKIRALTESMTAEAG